MKLSSIASYGAKINKNNERRKASLRCKGKNKKKMEKNNDHDFDHHRCERKHCLLPSGTCRVFIKASGNSSNSL